MAKKLYEEEKIRAIAERIKKFSGDDTPMTTAQMPDGVSLVRMASFASGYDEGQVYVKTNEARTANDIIGTPSTQTELEISVKAGYYAADTNKYFDVSFSYNEGYDEGKSDGYEEGYGDGYTDGEASGGGGGDYDEGWQEGYDCGYDDGYQDGWGDGYDEGKNETQNELYPLIEQAQSNDIVMPADTSYYYYPKEIYGSSGNGLTFDDMTEIEKSSISSNPFTVSISNYSSLYLMAYVYARDSANNNTFYANVIVPPNGDNSQEFISLSEPEWTYAIDYVRYSRDEL